MRTFKPFVLAELSASCTLSLRSSRFRFLCILSQAGETKGERKGAKKCASFLFAPLGLRETTATQATGLRRAVRVSPHKHQEKGLDRCFPRSGLFKVALSLIQAHLAVTKFSS